MLGVSKSIPIAIRGEAYDIHIDIKFPQEPHVGIDFGAQRVVDDCVKQLVLKNTEKYDVRFSFAINSDEVRQLITITPEAGVVPPGKEAVVTVRAPAPLCGSVLLVDGDTTHTHNTHKTHTKHTHTHLKHTQNTHTHKLTAHVHCHHWPAGALEQGLGPAQGGVLHSQHRHPADPD